MPKTLTITWKQFKSDVHLLTEKLHARENLRAREDLPMGAWSRLVAVTRGGLAPAALLSRTLPIVMVDTICIGSYDGRLCREGFVHKPLRDKDSGKHWLVVDDLVDSGGTAQLVRYMLPESTIAVVYAKPDGIPFADVYAKEIPQDTWIIFPWEVEAD